MREARSALQPISRGFFTTRLAALALSFAVFWPAPALPARSDWAAGDSSRLRLLATRLASGELAGGVEIELEPGWHTYWRAPGDVGVPPRFDFTGSENVAAVEVLYPAPERLDDPSGVSVIYADHVVLPLAVTPADEAAPVTLRLKAFYGVCREVCIPAEAEAEVTIGSDSGPDALARVAIERYRPRVPGPALPGVLDVEGVRREGGALLIDVRAPDGGAVDLFVEGPGHWFLGQPRLVERTGGLARFRLSLDGVPEAERGGGGELRVVAVAGGRAIEEIVALAP